jgi:PhzF family phenazine biosynthesis protein
MKLPLIQVDAFTSLLFGGNPAAVILLEDWLPDETLLAIANENNLSETAYIVPCGDFFELRWFTPTIEVDLCGHATLASAFVLFEDGHVQGDEIIFETRHSGRLIVTRDESTISLNFPSRPTEPATGLDDAVADALGAVPSEVHMAQRDLLVLFESEADIVTLEPDFRKIAGLDAFAVIVTAPGNKSDFVSRFFAPNAGIDEDPVTGSAHCTLTPFWSARLGRKKLHAVQVSRRRGELFCEDRGDRVIISGQAVEYLRGEINVS